MQQLVSSRWYALAEFILAFALGSLLMVQPTWGIWLVMILLIPWVMKLLVGQVPFGLSVFSIFVGLILLTAMVGVWAAYDQPTALGKLWVICGAVAIFAALVNQPRANLGVVASLVGLMGVFIAVFFLLTNQWQTQSSDLDLITRAGEIIALYRPGVDWKGIPPNFSGGLLAILAPIPIALTYHFGKQGKWLPSTLFLGMEVPILVGLFLSSSRGAWLALAGGIGLWLVWQFSLYLSQKAGKSPFLLFSLLLLVILLPLAWVVSILPGGLVGIADMLPGLPSGGSRFDLAVNTAKLIGDYPFTGGGLRSFAGQYSQYMMVTPFFLYAYSHNLYLDVIFEQGFVGGLSILAVIIGAALWLMGAGNSSPNSSPIVPLSAAVITSSFVILLHGFIDDALYGEIGSPLLFLVPGFAILLTRHRTPKTGQRTQLRIVSSQIKLITGNTYIRVLAGLAIVLVIVGFFVFRGPFLSSWNANLGAINLARWELFAWPRNQWLADPDVSALNPEQGRFKLAASQNQNQRTAWHRSGLIDLQARHFEVAQTKLEKAYQIDPVHRGIKKMLGYVYAWNGAYEQAEEMLQSIEEASDEMAVYAWWWEEQNRSDLARQADKMAQLLEQ